LDPLGIFNGKVGRNSNEAKNFKFQRSIESDPSPGFTGGENNKIQESIEIWIDIEKDKEFHQ
jgi:hypothetical protein